MRGRAFLAVVSLLTTFLFNSNLARAEFRRIVAIGIPGAPLVSFDISWVDNWGRTYYLTDRSNAGIDIFDARRNRFEGRIGGFVGVDPRGTAYSGPNGVLVVERRNELWVTDGDSTIKVIDLRSRQIVDTINTGGAKRADELAYDPHDQLPRFQFLSSKGEAAVRTVWQLGRATRFWLVTVWAGQTVRR